MLARVDGEKRGRLQFAPNQLFGRRFENCLRERTERPRLAGPEIINLELEAALRLMMGLLEKNSPRTVDARHFDWFRMYVDASFEPVAIQVLAAIFTSHDQKIAILELEGLAILTALRTFRD
ncbi:unnamed protein product [Cladocopium goreaui]|uniref:Uncharacterized protein n=1 Tax=Cladocopium goreaui TaxID=2562237 RepID=A0A9P1DBZ3_9DINO|nr:unnamed protein product [Cladocopium goreaui]